MAIPENVKKQADEADKKLQELALQTEEPPEVQEEEQLEEEQAELVVEDRNVEAELSAEKHKYAVLQGKYNAEVPRLSEEIRELREQIKQLQEKPSPENDDLKNRLTGYGDEFGELYETVKAQMDQVNKLKSELQKTDKRNEDVAAKQTEATYVQILGTMVPDWEQVNLDPKFMEWLGQVDPMFWRNSNDVGLTRHAVLADAHSKFDSERVVRFFNAFKAANKSQPKEKQDLRRQVAPDTSKTTSEPRKAPVVNMTDYQKFAEDVAKGKYRNRPDEFHRLQKQFDEAIRAQ